MPSAKYSLCIDHELTFLQLVNFKILSFETMSIGNINRTGDKFRAGKRESYCKGMLTSTSSEGASHKYLVEINKAKWPRLGRIKESIEFTDPCRFRETRRRGKQKRPCAGRRTEDCTLTLLRFDGESLCSSIYQQVGQKERRSRERGWYSQGNVESHPEEGQRRRRRLAAQLRCT